MAWIVGILKFIFSFLGFGSTGLLILSLIFSIQKPRFIIDKEGHAVEENDNFRLIMLFILSICWSLVIVLP